MTPDIIEGQPTQDEDSPPEDFVLNDEQLQAVLDADEFIDDFSDEIFDDDDLPFLQLPSEGEFAENGTPFGWDITDIYREQGEYEE